MKFPSHNFVNYIINEFHGITMSNIKVISLIPCNPKYQTYIMAENVFTEN